MQLSLRSFLCFAYNGSYIGRDLSPLIPSVRKRRMAHVPRCLPAQCIQTLMGDIKRNTPAGLRDSAIVCLLGTYGVRGVQVRRLHLEHVDWANGRIHFPAAKRGRPIRQVLTDDAGNRLADYISQGRPDTSQSAVFLTLSEPFRPLPCASYLSGMVHRRIKQLGLTVPKGVSCGTHGFRHAFATRMTGQVPFKDVMDMLGHRDPGSTLIYGKVAYDDLKQAALPWPGGEL